MLARHYMLAGIHVLYIYIGLHILQVSLFSKVQWVKNTPYRKYGNSQRCQSYKSVRINNP